MPRLPYDRNSKIYTCKCGDKFLKTRGAWMETCLDCLKREDNPKFLATNPYVSPVPSATNFQSERHISHITLVGEEVALGMGDE